MKSYIEKTKYRLNSYLIDELVFMNHFFLKVCREFIYTYNCIDIICPTNNIHYFCFD